MVLFLTLLAIPVLAIIIATIYGIAAHDAESAAMSVLVVCLIMFFPILLVGVNTFAQNPRTVNNFIFEKPLIEGSDNFLLIEKKNDWNEWLRDAQRNRKTWGAFTMQPEEVELLTPIE